ncbi:2Fe-2S iron-sulfur cluster-binding protein [Sphingomonas profundi]|uniref:2Fe-2S iron-sulfur cluster-binding protein n=1 Tax=Alterirhizorhabdus profundi TaxID=2681549 RepID=UPI0012E84EE0|nr:2Fe-2S iron-sulfur cluster-binding protein [Sphingomonas profundi]
MVMVHFMSADGVARSVDAQAGTSLMEAAIWNGVDGIEALCGGACACGTCHVHVADAWRDRLDPPLALERELLALAPDPRPGSRLACQIRLDDALDGLSVATPAEQISA